MSTGRHRRPSLLLPVLGTVLLVVGTFLACAWASAPAVSIRNPAVPACRDTGTDLYRDGRTWWTRSCDP